MTVTSAYLVFVKGWEPPIAMLSVAVLGIALILLLIALYFALLPHEQRKQAILEFKIGLKAEFDAMLRQIKLKK